MCPDGGALFGFAQNHMTFAKASHTELPKTEEALRCVGIVERNDLCWPMFDGLSAKAAEQASMHANLAILALAVERFYCDAQNAVGNCPCCVVDR